MPQYECPSCGDLCGCRCPCDEPEELAFEAVEEEAEGSTKQDGGAVGDDEEEE